MKLLVAAAALVGAVGIATAAVSCDKFFIEPPNSPINQTSLASTRAQILVYRDVDSDSSSAMGDPALIDALTTAGHTALVADGIAALASSVKKGSFDIVLVDYASAQKVREKIKTLAPRAKVVPVLDRTSRQHLSEAKKQFTVVINIPATVTSVLTTIDKAMANP